MTLSTRPIVITGATGILGPIVARHLSDHPLIGLGRRPATPPVPGMTMIRADVGDAEQMKAALGGCGLVVHLAATVSTNAQFEPIRRANIDGVVNVLEAARMAGARGVVFASSLEVIAGHIDGIQDFMARAPQSPRKEKIAFLDALQPLRPVSLYSASKIWGEALCRLYHDVHGLPCSVVRIGEVTQDDVPDLSSPIARFRWCSAADFLTALDQSLEDVRGGRFSISTAISSQ